MTAFLRAHSGVATTRFDLEVRNVRLLGAATATAASAADASPFSKLGLKPDSSKAYIEFELCHSLPVVAGPVREGNYVGYLPGTLAASHQSLQHQQVNLRHLLKAYDPDGVTRDRIIGCVVATAFPKEPAGGWPKISEMTEKTAPAIRACAVIFKLAEGVPVLLERHASSREKQSVSIEARTPWDNVGLWLPSAPDVVTPLKEPGELADALREGTDGMVIAGTHKGEQVVQVYGLRGGAPIEFRGVGVTPKPAEREARIVSVEAEECRIMAIAAELHDGLVPIGEGIRFKSGNVGKVVEVVTSGTVQTEWARIEASLGRPVLKVRLPDGKIVLKRGGEDPNAGFETFCETARIYTGGRRPQKAPAGGSPPAKVYW